MPGMQHPPKRGQRGHGGCLPSCRGFTLAPRSDGTRGIPVRVDPRHQLATVGRWTAPFRSTAGAIPPHGRGGAPGRFAWEGRCWRMVYENVAGHWNAMHGAGGVGLAVEVSRWLDEGMELRAGTLMSWWLLDGCNELHTM